MSLNTGFLLGRWLEPTELTTALADAVGVPVARVDVGHLDGDPEQRDWDADVVCTYHEVLGDVVMSLDLWVRDGAADGSTNEADLASAFAGYAGTVVIYSDDRIGSTWWLAGPGGVLTRARMYEADPDEVEAGEVEAGGVEAGGVEQPPRFTLDAVESAVAVFPDVKVTPLEELLWETPIDTPITDAVRLLVPGSRAVTTLHSWERLVRRMAAQWPPAGHYLPEMYADDLAQRDAFEADLARCQHTERELLLEAMAQLDELFRVHTADDAGAALRAAGVHGDGWRWSRRPRRLPWPVQPADWSSLAP